jgi:peptidase E
MKLLLLSNSANKGEDYLVYPKNEIISFLGNKVKEIEDKLGKKITTPTPT